MARQGERWTRAARVAYFSMEVGIDNEIPTYSGGLGILAGDTLRAAADRGVPMVGITLLHRLGYFRQRLGAGGVQMEEPNPWDPPEHLEPVPERALIQLDGNPVQVRAWRMVVLGASGHTVPVYFLDTALPENGPWERMLTDQLYGGDARYRLGQEAVLGLGGVALLEALGYRRIKVFHMNEGHSALLALALLEERTGGRLSGLTPLSLETVRQSCVFTTHTPVPAGHDRFPMSLVRGVLGEERASALEAARCCLDGELNMTFLALAASRYVNGVSMRHEEISRGMFPAYPVNSITNGVHAPTWTSAPFRRLFDAHIPEWRRDNHYLRYAVGIPLGEIREAHDAAKGALVAEVERRAGVRLDPRALTIGLARRATPYKRMDLLFTDPDRLRAIAERAGPLQVVCAGKAHPRDQAGKDVIRRIVAAGAALGPRVPVVYLEGYDIGLAKVLCAGADLWLNTPQKPQEASGTSGMKAALNGVPSLSVLDGWWVEGHIEGVTGWRIGDEAAVPGDAGKEAASLYDQLERVVAPLFFSDPGGYGKVMRGAIALNGSYFNAQRMVVQYLENAYRPEAG